MDSAMLFEVIGYIASFLVAVSLTMSSILRLRLVNLVGAAVFTLYGVLIQAFPVAAVNFFIVLIDLYYLYKIFSDRAYFRLLEVPPDSKYLAYFLSFYQDDIQRFLPGFTYQPNNAQIRIFVLRDLVPAGLLIGEHHPPGSLQIHLDFVIPGYRDFKVARFLFREQARFFTDLGIHQVLSPPGAPRHRAYLRRMGFRLREVNGESCYYMSIPAH